ncbi:MAG: hypothetical protein LBC61_07470 [Candidatus Peribacteria bacterium]|jgi:hypothetical protein|nr:hypothetical protein [Candidatus Peribacteria bacterium]
MSFGTFFGIISQFSFLSKSKVGTQIERANFFEVTFKSKFSFLGFLGNEKIFEISRLERVKDFQ